MSQAANIQQNFYPIKREKCDTRKTWLHDEHTYSIVGNRDSGVVAIYNHYSSKAKINRFRKQNASPIIEGIIW